MGFTVKFIIGVAVGWWLFHPVSEDSKFDQATVNALRKAGEKCADFIIKKFDGVGD